MTVLATGPAGTLTATLPDSVLPFGDGILEHPRGAPSHGGQWNVIARYASADDRAAVYYLAEVRGRRDGEGIAWEPTGRQEEVVVRVVTVTPEAVGDAPPADPFDECRFVDNASCTDKAPHFAALAQSAGLLRAYAAYMLARAVAKEAAEAEAAAAAAAAEPAP